MDVGEQRAVAGMYRQLMRVFRLPESLGNWRRAANGILQGCPLSAILIILLTAVWKPEMDYMPRHVVLTTAAPPPLRNQPHAASDQPPPMPPLHAHGPGHDDGCPLGSRVDTQAFTLGPQPGPHGVSESQAVVEWMDVSLLDTGQGTNVPKSDF